MLPFFRLLTCLCLVGIPAGSARASSTSVGCQHLITPSGLELGIWYPSQGIPHRQNLGPYEQTCIPDGPVTGRNRALIVFSHGTGGSWSGHLDTAAALAHEGYVVVAMTEPGDNWRDQSRVTDLVGRTRALSATLDYVLSLWPGRTRLDSTRIGAFGFSAGGLTVLLALGAKPDFARIASWCQAQPHSFTCALLAHRQKTLDTALPDLTDRRLKAAVIAAPALGFTMSREALASVRIPVQLWQAQNDRILPSPGSVEPVRDGLAQRPETHLVPLAGHFDFLAPCRSGFETLSICQSDHAFDRAGFHAGFNAALGRFFDDTLRARPRSDTPR